MLPSRCLFQQDNAKPHTAAITTAWLRGRRVRVLNWPACSPDLSPIVNIWHIIKRKIRQSWPRILQQLESYIRQEWDQIPTPKLQKLITSMPRRLQTDLKRSGEVVVYIFSQKTENVLCILAVHLHDNVDLEAWKHKLLKMIFKVHIFENNTISVFVWMTKTWIGENDYIICMLIVFSLKVFAHARSVSL